MWSCGRPQAASRASRCARLCSLRFLPQRLDAGHQLIRSLARGSGLRLRDSQLGVQLRLLRERLGVLLVLLAQGSARLIQALLRTLQLERAGLGIAERLLRLVD